MALTQIRSPQIENAGVTRDDVNVATTTKAVIAKLIQGAGLTVTATGGDAGTGDVTVRIADMAATQRVIGRNSGGGGAQEEVTATQLLDWLSSTRGSILYRGASGWAALTPGTAGHVLKSNGAGADPAWGEAQVDLTPYHLVSAGSTNATVVKASAGKLYGWKIYNNNAAMRKVAFHNTASTPTAGASIAWTLNIPGLGAANVLGENPIAFTTGISFTTVTDNTDAGTTAVAAGDLTINLFYV